MSNTKNKIRYKLLAVALSVMMLIAMVPVTVLTSAWGNTDPAYDYLSAQDFTVTYAAEDDSIRVSWTAVAGDVDALSLTVNNGEAVALETDATSYTAPAETYAGQTVYVALTAVCGEESRTVEASASVPATLVSVRPVPKMQVDNNTALSDILHQLPTEALVSIEGQSDLSLVPVTWSADDITYDRALATEQAFTVYGRVSLPDTILNRKDVDLTTAVNVIVTAAVDVSIKTDLSTEAINKLAGESLTLSVEAEGTIVSYQWYHNDTAIDGACSSTLSINDLALTDSGSYYCFINGKNESAAASQIATVNVSKQDTTVGIAVIPQKGQTRPQGITLEATGLPKDAQGTLVFLANNSIIGEIALPATSIDFRAAGAEDIYAFSVIYSGDDARYNGSTSEAMEYNFSKGTISVSTINNGVGLTGTAGNSMQLTPPTISLYPEPESDVDVTYTYKVDNPELAEVDANGLLTYKKAGSFTLIITATAGDDYNPGEVTIPVTVELATNSGLYFDKAADTVRYQSGFSYPGIHFNDNAKGNGELVFSIVSEGTTVENIAIDPKTGVITYVNIENDLDPDLTGNLTGEVVVCLTKESDGVYAPISATYKLTIVKGEQDRFFFENANVSVTYAGDGVNNHLTTGSQAPIGGSVTSDIVYSLTKGEGIVTLDPTSGVFTALKSGTAVIAATKLGNGLYEDVSCSYTVYVQKGTLQDFAFEKDAVSSVFGVPFNSNGNDIDDNKLIGAIGKVSYSISQYGSYLNSEYVSVDRDTGVVSFNSHYFAVESKNSYTVKITATKEDDDCYNLATATYTLVFNRASVSDDDFTLTGADKQSNGEILSTFGNANSVYDCITFAPANGYTSILVEGQSEWMDSLSLDTEGSYNIAFYLKKDSGEISQRIVKDVIVDTSGPTASISMEENYFRDVSDRIGSMWSGFTHVLSFNLWKESDKSVTIEAKDKYSDIHKIEYFVQTDGFVSLDENKEITPEDIDSLVSGFQWIACDNIVIKGDSDNRNNKSFTGTFTIDLPANTTKQVVVYVKVTDVAGNVSYFRSNGVVFDSMNPTYQGPVLPNSIINITLPEPNGQVGLYNNDVHFKLTVNDQGVNDITSGIQKIQVTVSGTDSDGAAYNKVTTVTANQSEIKEFHSDDIGLENFAKFFTVDGDFIIPASFNSNHLSILVEVWDYAGNYCSNKNSLTYLAVDSKKPEIEVTYNDYELSFSNDKYLGNGQHRQATIIINEVNFDPSLVDFSRILLDGKTLEVAPQFACVGSDVHGDGIVWEAVINFVEDGDYSFNISCTDKAKNKNNGWYGDDVSLNKYWTIDNTKPTIYVTMSNSNVSNDKYFADDRIATITITERNFSKDYSFNWNEITYKLDGIQMPAPQAKLIKSDSDTYEHVYTVSFTADGDYTFGVQYTDLADNAADGYTCYAVSHEAFTVDKTAPVINITGVADQSANRDIVAPIVTYADLNSDNSTLSIRLTGVNNGVVDYRHTESNITYGKMRSYANFERTQSVDDIYTLSVSLADKAGNLTSKTITFSVNRFGSTYDLSAIKDILGKYLREEQDIVFTETNVDELDHETLLIKVVKNGTPSALVEGTDYTVEKTGGDGKWSVYKYTIKKELFATDGHYDISIYSEDSAGNINENSDESKNAAISFAIDKTAPVIVPIDLEDDTPYAVDTKTVSLEIKDNLLLDGVKIFLNGEEVEYTADGDTYTFDIVKSNNKQDVEIVAVDAAGNEMPVEVKNFLVNANIFVRWFNNTPLFIGSLVVVVLLILALTALALFGKKKGAKQ